MVDTYVDMKHATARIVGFFRSYSIYGGVLHVFDIMDKEMQSRPSEGGKSPDFFCR